MHADELSSELALKRHLCASQCGFSADDELEKCVQECIIKAVIDHSVVMRLFQLPNTKKSEDILDVCQIHYALDSNMMQMDLLN